MSQTLQVESWEPDFEPLNLCPVEEAEPPFLAAAVEELVGLSTKDDRDRENTTGTVELGGRCWEYAIRPRPGRRDGGFA